MEVSSSHNQVKTICGFYGDFATKIDPNILDVNTKYPHKSYRELFNTQHGSKINEELLKLGVHNEKSILSSFLGDGIAHGLQSIFTTTPDLSGLAIDPSDDRESIRSKTLGRALMPLLREYIDQGRSMDTEFVSKAIEKIRYIPA